MLGFSREVAREVTHPLWPSRVPLRMSVSVILKVVGVAQSNCDVGLGEISRNRFCQMCGLGQSLILFWR